MTKLTLKALIQAGKNNSRYVAQAENGTVYSTLVPTADNLIGTVVEKEDKALEGKGLSFNRLAEVFGADAYVVKDGNGWKVATQDTEGAVSLKSEAKPKPDPAKKAAKAALKDVKKAAKHETPKPVTVVDAPVLENNPEMNVPEEQTDGFKEEFGDGTDGELDGDFLI